MLILFLSGQIVRLVKRLMASRTLRFHNLVVDSPTVWFHQLYPRRENLRIATAWLGPSGKDFNSGFVLDCGFAKRYGTPKGNKNFGCRTGFGGN